MVRMSSGRVGKHFQKRLATITTHSFPSMSRNTTQKRVTKQCEIGKISRNMGNFTYSWVEGQFSEERNVHVNTHLLGPASCRCKYDRGALNSKRIGTIFQKPNRKKKEANLVEIFVR